MKCDQNYLSMLSSDFILIFISNPLQNWFFKCCTDPRHCAVPLTRTTIRVQRASLSSMLCVVRTINLPFSRDLLTRFHKLRLVVGSMPVVGSSKRITLLLPMNARLVLNFLLLPPLLPYRKRDHLKMSIPFNVKFQLFTLILSHVCQCAE